MIEPSRFIEKKGVSVAEEEQRRAYAVEETNGNKQCDNAESCPVNVKAIPRPRLHPRESVILEQKSWLDPIRRDPTIVKVSPDFPDHQKAKCDSKKNQGCDIDWREGVLRDVH